MPEHCPLHGDFVATCAAPLQLPEPATLFGGIVKELPITPIKDARLVPLPIFIQRLEAAAAELNRNSPHPKSSCLTGVRVEVVEKVKVVLARGHGPKQKSLDDEDLDGAAIRELKISKDTYDRMTPIAKLLVERGASAERVTAAVRQDPNPSQARIALANLVTKRQPLELGGEPMIATKLQGLPRVEVAADRIYALRLRVKNISAETGDVDCALMGGTDLHALFESKDLEERTLHFRVAHEPFFFLAQCASLSVVFEAKASVRMSWNAKGELSYRCELISFVNPEALMTALRDNASERYASLELLHGR